MIKKTLLVSIAVCFGLNSIIAQEKEYPKQAPMSPAMSEYWLPQPAVVTPVKSPQEALNAPSEIGRAHV